MIYATIFTNPPMPQNSEGLALVYKKIIEPKLKDWVIFEQGTCVIIYKTQGDLKNEAIEILKKYGLVTPGSSSADFQVLKINSGWIVYGDQSGILNYVTEGEGRGKEDYEIGMIGRNKKEQDSKELNIIYVNK